MGQKIHPTSFRLGVTKNWASRWFLRGKYARYLEEDEAIRKTILSKIGQAGVSAIEIERTASNIRVHIKAAKPGFVIGRGGKGIEELNRAVIAAIKKVRGLGQVPQLGSGRAGRAPRSHSRPRGEARSSGAAGQATPSVSLNVEELKRNEVSAQYIAQQISWDIEKRMPFRRTIKKYLESIMQHKEVKGARIRISGRLDGSEIARTEWLSKGSLPLQTLRSDIDYGQVTAFCTYGTIGIKVWVYKGEKVSHQ